MDDLRLRDTTFPPPPPLCLVETPGTESNIVGLDNTKRHKTRTMSPVRTMLSGSWTLGAFSMDDIEGLDSLVKAHIRRDGTSSDRT